MQEEKISSNYKNLQSCDSVLPRIYGLPKIHKTNVPLRLIVSFIGSTTYHMSKCFKCILSPLDSKTNFTTKISTEFVRSCFKILLQAIRKNKCRIISLVYSPPYHLIWQSKLCLIDLAVILSQRIVPH